MDETFYIPEHADRATRYTIINDQLPFLMDRKAGRIANLSNAAAMLNQAFGFHWIGFYLVHEVDGQPELVLGPFQGPIACTRIGFGRGVCGTAWKEGQPIIVPDVDQFPGHIACSSLSRSEIVVPLYKDNVIIGVLDIDSVVPGDFSEADRDALVIICKQLEDFV